VKAWLAGGALVGAVTVGVPLALVAGAGPLQEQGGGCGAVAAVGAPAAGTSSASAEQLGIMRTAARIADQRGLPGRAKLVIGVTGMQESGIRVYANDNPAYPEVRRISMALPHSAVGHDHDSVGWLQQRPLEGDGTWGRVKDLMNPAYAAGKFYDALVRVPGWESLPVTVAAQRVQVSAYPDAYAKHEPFVRALLTQLGDTSSVEPCTEVSGGGPAGGLVPALGEALVTNPSGKTTMDGKIVSRVVAAQVMLAERESGISMSIMQGGFGGSGYAASGTSHNYSGVIDVSPGSVAAEAALRRAGFAAWSRNIPGRSYVGSGEHVHAVSLLDPGDAKHPQVTGSWARHENGLDGRADPAPHYAWYPSLLKLTKKTP